MDYDEITLSYMQQIENALDRALAEDENASSQVLHAMRYSLLGGGKRVRGILTLAASEMVCKEYLPAMPAACAIEMIHCYSLIHDDLPAMDDDDRRRGKASCHKAYGEAVAILAGDALLTEAFHQLTYLKDSDAAVRCAAVLAQAAGYEGMVLGQELDLASEGKVRTPAPVSRLQALKTGALLKASVRMGAIIAGASPQQEEALSDYAGGLGLTFQIVDDILDVIAKEDVLGKPTGSDSKSKKATSVSIMGIENARTLAGELTARGIAALRNTFDESGYLTAFAKSLLDRER
jgi:geranylgeranyl pyrophosphate synthase